MFKKVKNRLTYECSTTETEVVCGVNSSNPHDVNHEIRCSIPEFLENTTSNAQRCHDLVLSYFGEENLKLLINKLQKLS